MRPCLALVLVLVSFAAHGDSSVGTLGAPRDPWPPDRPGPTHGTPASCRWDNAPHWRAAREAVKISPDRRLVDFSRRHLLLGGETHHARNQPRSVVFDRATRARVLTIAGDPDALVENAAGLVFATLHHGAAGRSPTLEFRDAHATAARWKVPWRGRRNTRRHSTTTLFWGDQLIIAHFQTTAGGADLLAVDVQTGATRWLADPEHRKAAYSEYFNGVTLERRGEAVVMRGYEAAGCFVRTFDLATGKLVSSTINRD